MISIVLVVVGSDRWQSVVKDGAVRLGSAKSHLMHRDARFRAAHSWRKRGNGWGGALSAPKNIDQSCAGRWGDNHIGAFYYCEFGRRCGMPGALSWLTSDLLQRARMSSTI